MKYQHFKMRNNCSITVSQIWWISWTKITIKYECLVQNGMHCKKKDNCTVIYDNMWCVLPSFVWLSCHPCTQPEDSILNRRVSNDSMTKIMWQAKQERLPVDAAMNNAPCQQTEVLCLSFATLRVRPNHKISLPRSYQFIISWKTCLRNVMLCYFENHNATFARCLC